MELPKRKIRGYRLGIYEKDFEFYQNVFKFVYLKMVKEGLVLQDLPDHQLIEDPNKLMGIMEGFSDACRGEETPVVILILTQKHSRFYNELAKIKDCKLFHLQDEVILEAFQTINYEEIKSQITTFVSKTLGIPQEDSSGSIFHRNQRRQSMNRHFESDQQPGTSTQHNGSKDFNQFNPGPQRSFQHQKNPHYEQENRVQSLDRMDNYNSNSSPIKSNRGRGRGGSRIHHDNRRSSHHSVTGQRQQTNRWEQSSLVEGRRPLNKHANKWNQQQQNHQQRNSSPSVSKNDYVDHVDGSEVGFENPWYRRQQECDAYEPAQDQQYQSVRPVSPVESNISFKTNDPTYRMNRDFRDEDDDIAFGTSYTAPSERTVQERRKSESSDSNPPTICSSGSSITEIAYNECLVDETKSYIYELEDVMPQFQVAPKPTRPPPPRMSVDELHSINKMFKETGDAAQSLDALDCSKFYTLLNNPHGDLRGDMKTLRAIECVVNHKSRTPLYKPQAIHFISKVIESRFIPYILDSYPLKFAVDEEYSTLSCMMQVFRSVRFIEIRLTENWLDQWEMVYNTISKSLPDYWIRKPDRAEWVMDSCKYVVDDAARVWFKQRGENLQLDHRVFRSSVSIYGINKRMWSLYKGGDYMFRKYPVCIKQKDIKRVDLVVQQKTSFHDAGEYLDFLFKSAWSYMVSDIHKWFTSPTNLDNIERKSSNFVAYECKAFCERSCYQILHDCQFVYRLKLKVELPVDMIKPGHYVFVSQPTQPLMEPMYAKVVRIQGNEIFLDFLKICSLRRGMCLLQFLWIDFDVTRSILSSIRNDTLLTPCPFERYVVDGCITERRPEYIARPSILSSDPVDRTIIKFYENQRKFVTRELSNNDAGWPAFIDQEKMKKEMENPLVLLYPSYDQDLSQFQRIILNNQEYSINMLIEGYAAHRDVSQKMAVATSLLNEFSIVDGPAASGKTQTTMHLVTNMCENRHRFKTLKPVVVIFNSASTMDHFNKEFLPRLKDANTRIFRYKHYGPLLISFGSEDSNLCLSIDKITNDYKGCVDEEYMKMIHMRLKMNETYDKIDKNMRIAQLCYNDCINFYQVEEEMSEDHKAGFDTMVNLYSIKRNKGYIEKISYDEALACWLLAKTTRDADNCIDLDGPECYDQITTPQPKPEIYTKRPYKKPNVTYEEKKWIDSTLKDNYGKLVTGQRNFSYKLAEMFLREQPKYMNVEQNYCDNLDGRCMFTLCKEDRWELYKSWMHLRYESAIENIYLNQNILMKQKEDFDKVKTRLYQSLCIQSLCITATVDSLAEHRDIINDIDPHILIVNEAEEIPAFMTHVAMFKSLKQCVLIGDSAVARKDSLFKIMLDKNLKCSKLTCQYRMFPLLMDTIIKPVFYDTIVENVLGDNQRNSEIESQLLFFDHFSEQSYECRRRSYYNLDEAKMAIALADRLRRTYLDSSIVIICMYDAQRYMIKEKLNDRGGDNHQVHTPYSFGDNEADIVIISCVKAPSTSREQYNYTIFDKRTILKALTRAKHALYMFGNSEYLRKDTIWDSILDKLQDKQLITDKMEFDGKKLLTDDLQELLDIELITESDIELPNEQDIELPNEWDIELPSELDNELLTDEIEEEEKQEVNVEVESKSEPNAEVEEQQNSVETCNNEFTPKPRSQSFGSTTFSTSNTVKRPSAGSCGTIYLSARQSEDSSTATRDFEDFHLVDDKTISQDVVLSLTAPAAEEVAERFSEISSSVKFETSVTDSTTDPSTTETSTTE